jgi:hypothetical protein
MSKIILTTCLFLISITCFSQEEKNGTIYIKHPYIQVVNKSVKAYLEKDVATNSKLYADTAKFWVTGMPKPIPIADAFKNWTADFDYYDSIRVKVVGYPDYLAYVDADAKVVQSWWTWFGKSKKTGHNLRIDFVQFDNFNKEGKIEFESLYGDFSQMGKD